MISVAQNKLSSAALTKVQKNKYVLALDPYVFVVSRQKSVEKRLLGPADKLFHTRATQSCVCRVTSCWFLEQRVLNETLTVSKPKVPSARHCDRYK